MGFLIRFTDKDDGAFQALWEALQIASRPKTPREMRTALTIEDKLLDISKDAHADTQIQCPKCRETSPMVHYNRFEWWRIQKLRTLSQGATIFFEEEHFAYLKQVLADIQPPQPKVRDFVKLWDILEDAEKNWKGSEVELREKLKEPAAGPHAVGETA